MKSTGKIVTTQMPRVYLRRQGRPALFCGPDEKDKTQNSVLMFHTEQDALDFRLRMGPRCQDFQPVQLQRPAEFLYLLQKALDLNARWICIPMGQDEGMGGWGFLEIFTVLDMLRTKPSDFPVMPLPQSQQRISGDVDKKE